MREQERWQLSGSGPESYERYQVPSVFEPLAKTFLDQVQVAAGQSVLDVACGTGVVARMVAPIVGPRGRVVGVDINAEMLAVARQHAGWNDIEWRRGDAAALDLDDAVFDLALCQQGLQFFPDKLAALKEMRRVLRPGGRLGLCVWKSIEHSPCNEAIARSLLRHVGDVASDRIKAPFALGRAKDLRDLMEAAGFRDIDLRESVLTRRMLPPEISIPGHLASTPVAPDLQQLDHPTRARFLDEVGEALRPYLDSEGLAIPQGTFIALARR